MTHKERKEEVREILALDTDELVRRARGQLVLFPTLDEVYDYLAEEMVKEFAKAAKGRIMTNKRNAVSKEMKRFMLFLQFYYLFVLQRLG